MRQALVLSFALLVFASAAARAETCACPRNPTAESVLASSAAVFTGTVRAVTAIAPGQVVTTFVVSEPFKGVQRGQTVTVHHPSGTVHSCGAAFDPGRSYTLAASLQRGALWTSRCPVQMFAPEAGRADQLIARLRALRR